jgi:hypothetical protein
MFRSCFFSEVKIIDDPLASDGKALSIPGHNSFLTTYRLVRLPLSEVALIYTGPVRCYISVRCETTNKTGPAYSVGIYDNSLRKNIIQKNISLSDTNGKYQTFNLGILKLKPGMHLWITGPGNGSQVMSIVIDRAFVVNLE